MLNKAIARAQTIAERFKKLKAWEGGAISAKSKNDAGSGSLYIYDIIGQDWWTGDGITGKAVADALVGLRGVKVLNIYINSPGGDVFEAKAIYAQLQRFDAEKVVHIDGIAASAATFLAMAGDRIITAPEATWMVHEAWGGAMGEAQDLRDYADVLDMQNADLAQIYAKRTGGDVDDMRALMAKETWMNAAQALELKFTDEIATDDAEVEEDAKTAAQSSKSPMIAAARQTSERLALSTADRLAFIARARNGTPKTPQVAPAPATPDRASPAKRAQPASR